MPLLRRTPFLLTEPPPDLRPHEKVWQIRFTHEIFTNYSEYLERVNLYRRRIWTCKVTGKMHLTYEEALVSEKQANERLQQFPKELVGLVLNLVQFSMLKMNDLVTAIVEKLKDTFLEGEEFLGTVDSSSGMCKIMKVLDGNGGTSYEVGWFNESREVVRTSIEDKGNLIRKKSPFSRELLKLFIKESTFQSSPWIINSNLAKDYAVSTEPPSELREKIAKSQENGNVKAAKKRRVNEETDDSTGAKVQKKTMTAQSHDQTSMLSVKEKQPDIKKIKYPIDDLLVKPTSDDPVYTTRPVPCAKFLVPSDNVGNLLMIWDFLLYFGKGLHLSPFSVHEFESAIVYGGVPNLIAEAHIALLSLLIDDNVEYCTLIQRKKRKTPITLKTWEQYLCDFLELEHANRFEDHVSKIKKGNYNMLSVHVKLDILGELVNCAISTEAVRAQLDKCFEQKQSLMATKREELEELRKRRREKLMKETEANEHEGLDPGMKSINEPTPNSMHNHVQEDLLEDDSMRGPSEFYTKNLGESGSKLDVLTSRRALMKKNLETKNAIEREQQVARMEELKKLREENKARAMEAKDRKLREQRLEQLEREMEKLYIRVDPLGKDRDHNTYWFFQKEGRVYVESADHNLWGFYSSREELDALIGSLNRKGVRELALLRQLEKHYLKICSAFEKRSKEMSQVGLEDTAIFRRRSVRVSAVPKDDDQTPSFLRYVNKLRKE